MSAPTPAIVFDNQVASLDDFLPEFPADDVDFWLQAEGLGMEAHGSNNSSIAPLTAPSSSSMAPPAPVVSMAAPKQVVVSSAQSVVSDDDSTDRSQTRSPRKRARSTSSSNNSSSKTSSSRPAKSESAIELQKRLRRESNRVSAKKSRAAKKMKIEQMEVSLVKLQGENQKYKAFIAKMLHRPLHEVDAIVAADSAMQQGQPQAHF